MLVKICGLRRAEDISYVNEALPDHAGFILSPGFRRSISADQFSSLSSLLDKRIKAVGVFVDEDIKNVLALSDKLDVIQLHGSENAEYISNLRDSFSGEIWKAVRASSPEEIERADKLGADKLLIDSYVKGLVGGTGKTADTDIINTAVFETPFFLAGGISAENVSELTSLTMPVGVDASGSVETDGYKDKDKILTLVKTVRNLTNSEMRDPNE
ncbi:MAG: phosphoribosylanthranilate isomerase [Ruminococcus sp.]|nr:phosphoribosylanthranilate isomerase [Ruminococcus sp.]